MRIEAQALTGVSLTINGVKLKGVLKDAELPSKEYITKEVNSSIGKKELVLPTLKPMSLKVTLSAIDRALLALVTQSFTKNNLLMLEGNFSDNSKNLGFKAIAKGKFKKFDSLKLGIEEEVSLSIEMACYFYSELVENTPTFMFDVDNERLLPDGVNDIFEQIRSNI